MTRPRRERPVIDLSGGQYDDLEKKLSQTLGIKIMLVQGWQPSEAEQFAQGKIGIIFAGATSEDVDQAREEKMDELESQQQSQPERLRAHIAMRDKDLAASMTENELKSLLVVNHVTLRSGNCEPERAVIIFDPMDRIGDGCKALLGRNAFTNAWYRPRQQDYKTNANIYIADLIENDDIALDDWRAYQALMDVRYALMNQSEYNNMDKGWYYEPFFYSACNIDTDQAGLDKKYEKMDREECNKRLLRTDDLIHPVGYEKFGIKDEQLIKKLTLMQAVADLVSRNPIATFGRLTAYKSDGPTEEQILVLQKNLNNRLQKAAQSKIEDPRKAGWVGGDLEYLPPRDWRILFPVFREVYEQDASTGYEREYMDTIMKGLQRYFPTLTNGPVPEIDQDKEPPRTVDGYKARQTPPTPPPPPGPK